MSLCPKCRAPIKRDDKECSDCGVVFAHVRSTSRPQYYEPLPYVHCAHDGCPDGATTRVKTATGHANFCLQHYDEYFTEQARMYCVSRGLDTTAKQFKFCKETIAGMRKKIAA